MQASILIPSQSRCCSLLGFVVGFALSLGVTPAAWAQVSVSKSHSISVVGGRTLSTQTGGGLSSEIPTGESYRLSFTLRANIAESTQVTDIIFSECLSDDFFLLPDNAPDITDFTVMSSEGGINPAIEVVDRCITIDTLQGDTYPAAPLLTGSSITVTYSGFVPKEVIDPTIDAQKSVSNSVDLDYVLLGGASDTRTTSHSITARNLIVQKTVSNLTDPGNNFLVGHEAEYKIAAYASDHTGLGSINLTDLLGDGVTLNDASGVYWEHRTAAGAVSVATMNLPLVNGADFTINPTGANPAPPAQGETLIGIDLSAAGMPNLIGGHEAICTQTGCPGLVEPAGGIEASMLILTYRAWVDASFENPASYSGTATFDGGDSVDNSAEIVTQTIDGLAPVQDDDDATVRLALPTLSHTAVAINGVAYSGQLIFPGDEVTFRVALGLPTGDAEILDFSHTLATGFSGLSLSFCTGIPSELGVGAYPALNEICHENGVDYPGRNAGDPASVPTPSVTASVGGFDLDYPETPSIFPESVADTTEAEIVFLYTLAADGPMPGGTPVVNVATVDYGTSNQNASISSSATVFNGFPSVEVHTSFVQVDRPGANFIGPDPDIAGFPFYDDLNASGSFPTSTFPLVNDLRDVDAGDEVDIFVTLVNEGASPAHNLEVNLNFESLLLDPLGTGRYLSSATLQNVVYCDGIDDCTQPYTDAACALGQEYDDAAFDLAGGYQVDLCQLEGNGLMQSDPEAASPPNESVVILHFHAVVDSSTEGVGGTINTDDRFNATASITYAPTASPTVERYAAITDSAQLRIERYQHSAVVQSSSDTRTIDNPTGRTPLLVGETVTIRHTIVVPDGEGNLIFNLDLDRYRDLGSTDDQTRDLDFASATPLLAGNITYGSDLTSCAASPAITLVDEVLEVRWENGTDDCFHNAANATGQDLGAADTLSFDLTYEVRNTADNYTEGEDFELRVRASGAGVSRNYNVDISDPNLEILHVCGDGVVQITAGEECDDGAVPEPVGGYLGSATCTATCTLLCGNGVVDAGEQCDQGDRNPGDGCDELCQIESGDGYTCSGEPSVCSACGNGVLNVGEACDNDVGDPPLAGDGCSATCAIESGFSCSGSPSQCGNFCGNGLLNLGEGCDDGDAASGDGCSSICQPEPGYACPQPGNDCVASCGDGDLDLGESCDDGDIGTANDGCSASCQIEAGFECSLAEPSVCGLLCGNGVLDLGEACDDGDINSGDGCDSSCNREPGFACTGQPSTCAQTCGNGVVDAGEECDNDVGMPPMSGDGCTAECLVEPEITCGNGVVDAGDVCDDNNTESGDGCAANCQPEVGFDCDGASPSVCTAVCGDGIVVAGEPCDDGNDADDDACDDTGVVCALTSCGDGNIDLGEGCDDGALMAGDGCNALCQTETGYSCTGGAPSVCVPVCGDGVRIAPETCDDGNVDANDDCNDTCSNFCGNGRTELSLGEECDDGANVANDGCDPNCLAEDSDGDGIDDFTDLDDDNDGIADTAENVGFSDCNGDLIADDPVDTDCDTFPNQVDVDSDGDGIFDLVEAGMLASLDTASGSDGVVDSGWDTDTDDDGRPDAIDASVQGCLDSDNDDICDVADADCPEVGCITTQPDLDNDGVADTSDIDRDGDGIIDTVDTLPADNNAGALTSLPDTDGDGFLDLADLDSDNDGTGDAIEGTPDTDGDTIPDRLDLDSDNDGLSDVYEASLAGDDTLGSANSSSNGVLDDLEDSDNDGIPDGVDFDQGLCGPGAMDTDADGICDAFDVDVDGDTVLDNGADADGDGIRDTSDADANGNGFVDIYESLLFQDSDGDGVANRIDLDSDNDGLSDLEESDPAIARLDANGDGILDGGSAADTDSDGLHDALEAAADVGDFGGSSLTPPNAGFGDAPITVDTDNNSIGDAAQLGLPCNPIFDAACDGQLDAPNTLAGNDDDLDRIPDVFDADDVGCVAGDTTPDDGICDDVQGGPDLDGDGIQDSSDADDDGDGILDTVDSAPGVFGGVALADTDGDGLANVFDADDDGDGIADVDESAGDTDGDGVADNIDLDSDGDGIADWIEAADFGVGEDLNGNDIPDTTTDVDGDGLMDLWDQDLTDGPDVSGCEWIDTDDDAGNDCDLSSSGADPPDTDGDGFADVVDLDSDNDGTGDAIESTPDTDGDTIPDRLDLDSDNDGLSDVHEASLVADDTLGSESNSSNGVLDGLEDLDNDGIPDGVDIDQGLCGPGAMDTDADGICNAFDADVDGDTVLDNGADSDGDGIRDADDLDSNGNGFIDSYESLLFQDSDGDGVANRIDLDSDNDGLSDLEESNPESARLDANGDGILDGGSAADTDSDGLHDALEAAADVGSFGGSSLTPPNAGFGDATITVDTDNNGISDAAQLRLPCDLAADAACDGQLDGPNTLAGNDDDLDRIPNVFDADDVGCIAGDTTPDDGICDAVQGGPDLDGDGIQDSSDADDDGDGILDTVDSAPGVFGGVVLADTDDDGLANIFDADDDGDGIADIRESQGDSDGDGFADSIDLDSDGDGIPDWIEAADVGVGEDLNSDDIPDGDTDVDGDGIVDIWDENLTDGPDISGCEWIDTDDDAGNDCNLTHSSSPSLDTDSDGFINAVDLDSDNDGTSDAIEGISDTDSDTVPDRLDLDSDNDGLSDIREAGLASDDVLGGASNGNGLLDALDDRDNDGIPDGVDFDQGLCGAGAADTDSDGICNAADVDVNGDTVADNGTDTDGDGIRDASDADANGNGLVDIYEMLTPLDSDGDGVANRVDLDSDNDGLGDLEESDSIIARLDANGDGMLDGGSAADTDSDGLNDALEDPADVGIFGGSSLAPPDFGSGDASVNIDVDGNGIGDAAQLGLDCDPAADAACDGRLDGPNTLAGNDDDMDGIPNVLDANDASCIAGDTTPNDGICDAFQGGPDLDGDGIQDSSDADADGDGILDTVDSIPGVFGGTQLADSDGDGLANIIDADDDGDGIPDALEGDGDTDGDGFLDRLDLDSDNDGIPDWIEASEPGVGEDSDGDGRPDGNTDVDGDGIVDLWDQNMGDGPAVSGCEWADTDGNAANDCSLTASLRVLPDTDGDGSADLVDLDSDNDGLADLAESFEGFLAYDANNDGAIDAEPNGTLGLDANGDGWYDPASALVALAQNQPADTDSDGFWDVRDLDSDNDSIPDSIEIAAGLDADGNGLVDVAGSLANPTADVFDFDSDGVPNSRDLDSDNDGLPDIWEGGLVPVTTDSDSDGVLGNAALPFEDSDGDGILDLGDAAPDTLGTANGNASDFIDLDSNDDGTPDAQAAGLPCGTGTPDADCNGEIDTATDGDGDGLADVVDDSDGDGVVDAEDTDDDGDGQLDDVDLTPGRFGGLGAPDSDGDGVHNVADLDDDNDGIPDHLENDAGIDPDGDSDGDGVLNLWDAQSSDCINVGNDGICDSFSSFWDTDQDGVPNHRDLDSDNDGIVDAIESGFIGLEMPLGGVLGTVSGPFGLNGWTDLLEETPDDGVVTRPLLDTDGDGNPDVRDLDADGDGLFDSAEIGLCDDPLLDADCDGRLDIDTGEVFDGDGDGIVDALQNSSSRPIVVGANTGSEENSGDADGDGIPDDVDASQLGCSDMDGDDICDFADPQSLGDSAQDSDLDGIDDVHDKDDDNDGILDPYDPISNPNQSGGDSDGDGIVDVLECLGGWPCPDANNDGVPDYLDPDSDGDGVPDAQDSQNDDPCIPSSHVAACNPDGDAYGGDVDPLNTDPCTPDPKNAACDIDGDGVGGNVDLDDVDPCVPSSQSAACVPKIPMQDDAGTGEPSDPDEYDPNAPVTLSGGPASCAAGGAPSDSLWLMLVLGMWFGGRRRKKILPKRRISQALAACVLACAMWGISTAKAQVFERRNIDGNRLRLGMSKESILNVEVGATPGHLLFDAALWYNYENDPFVLTQNGQKVASLLRDRHDAHAVFALGLLDNFQIGVDLPVALYQKRPQSSQDLLGVSSLRAFGVGDLGITPKVQFLDAEDSFIDAALLLRLTVPTGSPRNHYMGDRKVAVTPELALSRQLGGWTFGGNLALLIRDRVRNPLFQTEVGSELIMRGGVSYDFSATSLAWPVVVKGSIEGFTQGSKPFSKRNVGGAEWLMGADYQIDPAWTVFGGGGTAFSQGYSIPDWRLFAGVRYARRVEDRDGDGIVDADDACPDDPEDKDMFDDLDGCEDPDNDGDGVLDKVDGAPNDAEDIDDFEDGDGVPDPDNDGDGVLDVADGAPNDAEDIDGFEDSDGVPDLDNDGDGILDNADGAPNDAEDVDGFEDGDGVPDPDNDGDGVLDGVDNCPQEAGTAENAGCVAEQKVAITGCSLDLSEKVYFNSGRAEIQTRSLDLLRNIAMVLANQPQMKRVVVEGHTDSVGSAASNLALSARRAQAVVDFLIAEGLAAERLQAVGRGEEAPSHSNETREGQESNRRVVFLLADCEEKVPEN